MKTRLQRELNTVKTMIRIYCKTNHKGKETPCNECSALEKYVTERIDNCPFNDDKPTCDTCTVHCYKKDKREEIRRIMRFAGPRMTYLHPVMAIVHLINKRRGKHGDELLELLGK